MGCSEENERPTFLHRLLGKHVAGAVCFPIPFFVYLMQQIVIFGQAACIHSAVKIAETY